MSLADVVKALLAGDLLVARQWVADAYRDDLVWQELDQPVGLSADELSVAAAIVELAASRAAALPPAWTTNVGPVAHTLVLDPGLEQMPRSFARAKSDGPEPLLRRNLIAMPDFLAVA